MQAACMTGTGNAKPGQAARETVADAPDVTLREVSFDRLVDGRVVASGRAATLFYRRAGGRFLAHQASATVRPGPGTEGLATLGELQLSAPEVSGELESQIAEAHGAIRAKVARGDSGAATHALYDGRTRTLRADVPVALSGPGYRVKGKSLLALANGDVELGGPVEGALEASSGTVSTPGSGARPLPPGPVDFGGGSMTIDKEKRTLLTGGVWFKKGDLTVTGDRAAAELAEQKPAGKLAGKPDPKKKPPKRKQAKIALPGAPGQGLSRFTVDGQVHVEREGRTADGEHAEFDAAAQTLTLTGGKDGPVLRDGQETLGGERVVLNLDTDAVEVTRPRLTLHRSDPGISGQLGEAAAAQGQPAPPVRVEASRLSLDTDRKLARFSDGVTLRRGDVTVKGPRMDARYDGKGELTSLELRGGVELRQGERRATGQTALYDAPAHSVVLSGDPHLYDRGDVLSGDRIQMGLDTHEVKIDRARGRLHPDQHQLEKQGAP